MCLSEFCHAIPPFAGLILLCASVDCSSSSSGGTDGTVVASDSGTDTVVAPDTGDDTSGGLYPDCKNPPATGQNSVACMTCLKANCDSLMQAFISACSAYFPCVEACDCSDDTCLLNCRPDITGDCASASAPVESCKIANCAPASVCAAPGDGG